MRNQTQNHAAPTVQIPHFFRLLFAGWFLSSRVLVFLPASEMPAAVSLTRWMWKSLLETKAAAKSFMLYPGGWGSTAATARPQRGAQGMRWGSALQTKLWVSHPEPQPKMFRAEIQCFEAQGKDDQPHAEHPMMAPSTAPGTHSKETICHRLVL